MPEQNPNPNTQKLIDAYNHMLEQAKKFLDETKQDAAPRIQTALEMASEKTEEVGELTREEINKVSDYVMRDLHDAAEFIAEQERELADWLRLDLLLIKQHILEIFSGMVDHTKLELDHLEQLAKQASQRHTGEITSIGALQCTNCKKIIHFHETGPIPPCPKCHGTTFERCTE